MKIPDYNKKIKHPTYLEMLEEIQRLKEEYVMLQNASDKVEEEKDREIEKLTFESTKWESKFYDEAKKVDKAIEYIHNHQPVFELSSKEQIQEWFEKDYYVELLNILKGSE